LANRSRAATNAAKSANESFGFLVRDVARHLSGCFERLASEAQLGLTLQQCRVLANLRQNVGIKQKDLAKASDIDQMTLLRLLAGLERDGWVVRSPDPRDGRARLLRLTPAVVPILDRIQGLSDKLSVVALAGLSASERTELFRLLRHVHGNLAQTHKPSQSQSA
jgi:DNA-binding MarR family transcriptional regulator